MIAKMARNTNRTRTAAGGLKAPMYITCVHQGYELYGSDRSFVESVQAIRAAFPAAEIEVVLPRTGAIVPLLQDLRLPHLHRTSVDPSPQEPEIAGDGRHGQAAARDLAGLAQDQAQRPRLYQHDRRRRLHPGVASVPAQVHHPRARDPRRNGALAPAPDAALERRGHHLQLARDASAFALPARIRPG